MIGHQSAQKFALDDVVVDGVGNGLKDAIQKDDGKLLEMGLQIPSKNDCWKEWKKCQNKSLVDLY